MSRNRLERRQFPRIPTDEPAFVKGLGPQPFRCSVRVKDVSSNGLRLLADEPLPVSAPVRIDVFEMMLLGEVCYCTLIDGVYHAGIVLEHVLADPKGLAELTAAIW